MTCGWGRCIPRLRLPRKDDLYTPAQARRLDLVESCHRHSGHNGIRRTESLLSKQYTWANMKSDINNAIDNCEACQRFQAKFNTDPTLHSIPVIPTAWHSLGIDVVGPFPTSITGKRYVIIAIDYVTKWVEAKAMKTQGSAETAVFMTKIIDRLGAPALIRTDLGTHFQGDFAKVLSANLVDHHVSRAYHPQ